MAGVSSNFIFQPWPPRSFLKNFVGFLRSVLAKASESVRIGISRGCKLFPRDPEALWKVAQECRHAMEGEGFVRCNAYVITLVGIKFRLRRKKKKKTSPSADTLPTLCAQPLLLSSEQPPPSFISKSKDIPHFSPRTSPPPCPRPLKQKRKNPKRRVNLMSPHHSGRPNSASNNPVANSGRQFLVPPALLLRSYRDYLENISTMEVESGQVISNSSRAQSGRPASD